MTPLQRRDLDVLWHPCAQMRDYRDFPPLEIIGADGCWLHLADGSLLLDVISSWWCKSLGHRHPGIADAIRRQLDAFDHVILANTTNEAVISLCERLLALADFGAGKVLFAESGSVGVEITLKLALQFQAQSGQPQRTRFAGLAGGYHGETVGAMSVSDSPLYTRHYRPFLFEALHLGPLPLRSGPDDPRWMDASAEWPAIAAQLDGAAEQLAAIIVEPVLQGAGGMLLYSPDLLRRLRVWCDAHGVLLIADEVASGCHRLGPFLASHLAGTRPDLVILGKGLTGGALPLAVVLATDAIAQRFDADWHEHKAFLHSSTFAGHALGVAAAHAALDAYAALDANTLVTARGAALRARLARERHPALGQVRGVGMLAAVDLLGCDPAHRTGYRVYREAVKRGVLLRPLGDTLYLLPPFAISDDEIDHACRVLGEAVLGTPSPSSAALRSSRAGARRSQVAPPGSSRPPTTAMLAPMPQIPAFSLAGSDGATHSDTSLKGTPFVLYLYPRDMTPGCTTESCDFRDRNADFAKLGVKVFGVSPDTLASHAKFIAKEGLTFTLLADPERKLITALGKWVEKNMYGKKSLGVQRSTFLIDAKGGIVHEWPKVKVTGHAAEVLAAAKELL